MISDRKQYIGINNNIVFELLQFLFMLEWILASISHFSAHIPTLFSVFMPNICCLDKLDNKHYAYRLIMMWKYGQKNEKYWPGTIPAHIRIGKVLNVVIFDTNNCLIKVHHFFCIWLSTWLSARSSALLPARLSARLSAQLSTRLSAPLSAPLSLSLIHI